MNNIELEEKAIRKWQGLKGNAEKRGLEFSLSVADVRKLIVKKRCYYTNKLLVRGENFSIDRLDNELGYIKGNVVVCDVRINQLKSNLSIKDLNNIFNKINNIK